MSLKLPPQTNSMQVYMIVFALSVIALLTALSVAIVWFAGPPQRTPMSAFDIARVVRGLPPALDGLSTQFARFEAEDVPPIGSKAERGLSEVLALKLKLPTASVRVHLGTRAPRYLDYVERQIAFSQEEGESNPTVYGTVSVAVRQPNGKWLVFERRSRDGFENVWQLLRASPWVGGLFIIPFSMWFSNWLARPVRTFALAAGEVGHGRKDFPVQEIGPTEIRVAAKALNEMQRRIRQYNQERTVLVGAIAHDLRTPLNSLRFRLAHAPEEVRISAERDIYRMEQLIGSTMDYIDSESRALTIDKVELASLLQSIVDDANDMGYDVVFSGERADVAGDVSILRRMFSNLVDNGLKYGTRVRIGLQVLPGSIVVDISDDGPGMELADMARAFEPFFRSEKSRNRETGGIGLGLSIAKLAANAHAGDISLSSSEMGGLNVRVSLPYG